MLPADAEMGARLGLSQNQSDWLLAHPVIRVGVDEGYPPANFWDSNGVVRGIDADFLGAIAEQTGLRFEFVKIASWAEAVEAVKRKEIDMLTCLSVTPEREEFLAFTEVYYDFPIAIITRSDAEFYSTPSAMRGQKVAVPEGFVTHEIMQQIGWEVEVVRVPTITDAYMAVSTGQCYTTVANLGNASYLIPRLGLTNLKISGVMPEFTRSRFAVRKDWAILAEIINKYFSTITEVERSAVVEKWVRLEVPKPFDWGFTFRVGLGLVLFGGGTVWLVLWRNRQLRMQLAERGRYQSALEEAHERVTRLSEEKSNLLHMVAHDMRGPLMTFQTGVGLVNHQLGDQSDPGVAEVLTRMERQTEAMQGLIDGLLDVEAIENGSRRLACQPVDFRACVEHVVERFQLMAQRKKIELKWHAPVGALKIEGDAVAVRQVIENLLSNALKYTPIGGQVVLSIVESAQEIQFEVRDTGPGIGQEEFTQLFVKFSRLSARPTDGESSHGLGLFIVKALVDSMHGKVWCQSQLGRGSTFCVVLPRS